MCQMISSVQSAHAVSTSRPATGHVGVEGQAAQVHRAAGPGQHR
jgi:hypothetical protein